ncbi:MAG: hypothetical protein AABN95_25290 [Acidobacteriota bacterium]
MTIPKLRLALVVGLTVFGLGLYYYLHLGKESPFAFVTLASPNGENTVEVSEKLEESNLPPTSRSAVVRFTLVHNGIRIIENEPLLTDSPGLHFFSRYPKQIWISNSTLRFIQSNVPPEPMRAEVLLINKTSREISYLRILAGDLFLVARIPPNSRINLEAESVSSQRGDLSYIASKGRFADGGEIREEGVNFNVNSKYADPAHYSIVINDAGTTISSQEFERYRF